MAGAATISPMILNTIQSEFLKHIGNIFESATGHAKTMFISIAIIELVVFGIVWAMRADNVFMEFIFKIIKLTVVFSFASSLPTIAAALLDNASFIANDVHSSAKATKLILNPGYIWQYGFDGSINLMKAALSSGSTNIALGNLYNLLGFGTLFLFCLIGAQIIVILCGFYLVSMAALFLIPFGALTVTKDLFNQAITQIIKLAVQVMILVIVISIAIKIWSQFDFSKFSATTTLDQPLGLFFSTLVICIMVYSLPKLVSNTVGHVGADIFRSLAPPSSSVSVTTPAPSVTVSAGGSPRAAAASGTNISATPGSSTTSTSSSSGSASSISAPGAASKSGNIFGGGDKKQTKAAVNLSQNSIEQLQSTISQSMKKK